MLKYSDKLLPNQAEQCKLFEGTDFPSRMYEVICQSSGIEDRFCSLQLSGSNRHTQEEMGSNPVTIAFLTFLIHVSGARRILEIGTFTGVSAIAFAKALPKGGRVLTVEKFPEFAAIARSNIEANGLGDVVQVLEGDAGDVLKGLHGHGTFDFIFIDGHKESYASYFEMADALASPNAIIVVDDCFFHGDALNKIPRTTKGQGVQDFLDAMTRRPNWVRIALPLSNGLFLATRRRADLTAI
jgi:caffeoyl-CoA O-methyltransferase